MNRSTFLALPVSLLALLACSSNKDSEPGANNPDAAPDTLPMDAGDDAAPDTLPMDTLPDTPPVTKEEGWDKDYALPGLMGLSTAQVTSVVVTSKRWVYVGGSFQHAGDVAANNIAVWNGAKWLAVGDGLPGDVVSLAANASDEVFAVVHKGSDYIVYQWDKTKWTDLTAQPDGQVQSIDVGADGSVWIAGYFNKVGTTSARGVARRKDGVWSAVGALGDHPLNVVRATPTGACVGGGAQPEDLGVACWNGTTWQQRKTGLYSGQVKALALDSMGRLLAGGEFATSTESGPGSIARWNETAAKWELVAGGVTGTVGGPGNVTGIAVRGDKIYLTGRFVDAGGINVRNVAMWSGTKWFDLEGGLAKHYGIAFGIAPMGEALALDDGGELYVGGMLTRAGNRNAMYLAHFNGTAWAPVDDPKAIRNGINGGAETVVVSEDGKRTYVGGSFSYVGGDVHAQSIGMLDQMGWHSLGAGLNDAVTSVALKDGNLYAGGHFTGSGTTSSGEPVIAASHLAMWNGTTWSGVGGGVDGQARVIAVAPDGKLWVGGDFEHAGTLPASRIAIWDGSKWSAVRAGLSEGGTPHVSAIAFLDGKVYAGGEFTKSGDKTLSNVAVWDGTSWSPLGDGFDRAVDSLGVYGGKLVAGGAFMKSGAKEVRHLAVWDGTTWTELGGGLPPADEFGTVVVSAIAVRGTDLFVTGIIDKAGTTKVSHLAKWNGTVWSDMGGGLNDTGGDLFVSNNSLWVAGAFSGVAKTPSIGIARYWFGK